MKKKQSSHHIRILEKSVKALHAEQKEQISTLQKEFKNVQTQHVSLENQMLIESMNKLAAVVKQLVILFNQKLAKEEGPLFAKLNEIIEQNEKVAEGILAVADMIKEKQTPPAPLREVNPYLPRLGPMPEQLRVQRSSPAEMQQPVLPPDFEQFQQPPAEETPLFMGPEPQLQPIPEHAAPLPPFSPVPQGAQQGERLPSRKRMLF